MSDLELLTGVNTPFEFNSFLTKWYENPLFGKVSKSSLIEEKLKQGPVKLKNSLKLLSVGNWPSFWEKIRDLKVPTLYLSGEDDKKYSLMGRELAELSPMITSITLKDCAHITHLEKPGVFRFHIDSFLSN